MRKTHCAPCSKWPMGPATSGHSARSPGPTSATPRLASKPKPSFKLSHRGPGRKQRLGPYDQGSQPAGKLYAWALRAPLPLWDGGHAAEVQSRYVVSRLTVRAHTQNRATPDAAEAARGEGPQTPPRQRVGAPPVGPGDPQMVQKHPKKKSG